MVAVVTMCIVVQMYWRINSDNFHTQWWSNQKKMLHHPDCTAVSFQRDQTKRIRLLFLTRHLQFVLKHVYFLFPFHERTVWWGLSSSSSSQYEAIIFGANCSHENVVRVHNDLDFVGQGHKMTLTLSVKVMTTACFDFYFSFNNCMYLVSISLL